MSLECYDITIIGGGPVGLFASFYAGLRQAKTKIIESLPQLGGQPGMLYPDKIIYDIAGFPSISAKDLTNNLLEQMDRFKPTICLGEEAFKVEVLENNQFLIHTPKQTHLTKTIIIAAGNGPFQPRRLEIENAAVYEDKQLHYFVNNIERFRDKVVTICGGGDSAVDWALTLEPIAKHVNIVHRRNKFRAQEHSVELLNQSSVDVYTPYVPLSINGDGERLESVTFKAPRGDEQLTLPCDEFIVNYGFSSSIAGLKDWGFNIERNTIPVDSRMQTNVPGIFAIGDIASYVGKVKIIATGFGEAPLAVNNAVAHINPDSNVQPMHSTSLF
ncbi:NAD(P)/FAD-dependent oxidoreductase [Atopobacter phocae]|uniref:NAD(P)/FAD-dependent oxidoreductase n=1 Tax=Atopobacter phocae TaxID=136492 RepID=UPI00046F946C|nr:NAD(P)/FAD-dependent oxidoreductase [Atopobacter phocae]